MKLEEKKITVAGHNWTEYRFTNDKGVSVSCLDFGGIITEIITPDQSGKFENVVLGYANYEEYLDNPNFFGALIGRVAGRIASASFSIDGIPITLPANEGNHHLHGGTAGFHQLNWQAKPFQTKDQVGVSFSHTSVAGDGGYPGQLEIKIIYTLTNTNDLSIRYTATSDQKTIFAPTNHSYFNLSGNLKRDILQHNVQIDASHFVELDHELIPTGAILPVDDSVFDFRIAHPIVDGVHSIDQQNLVASNGYDHYFIFDQDTNNQQPKVHVIDPESGRKLTVTTDQPGMVMYTSNNLNDSFQLKERQSSKYLGICLETQGSPASLVYDGFPSIILDKDELYDKTTTFSFETID